MPPSKWSYAASASAVTTTAAAGSAAARRCRWSLYPPIPPGRCMSAMVAAPPTARAWRTCSISPAIKSRASSISTTPAGRWTSWRCPPGCAIWNCSASTLPFRPTPTRVTMCGAWHARSGTLTAIATSASARRSCRECRRCRLPSARMPKRTGRARSTSMRSSPMPRSCSATTSPTSISMHCRNSSPTAARISPNSACISTTGSRRDRCSTPV